VNLLLDFQAPRDMKALDLLFGEAREAIFIRLDEERKEVEKKEQQKRMLQGEWAAHVLKGSRGACADVRTSARG
jgi:hypothetical protein